MREEDEAEKRQAKFNTIKNEHLELTEEQKLQDEILMKKF